MINDKSQGSIAKHLRYDGLTLIRQTIIISEML